METNETEIEEVNRLDLLMALAEFIKDNPRDFDPFTSFCELHYKNGWFRKPTIMYRGGIAFMFCKMIGVDFATDKSSYSALAQDMLDLSYKEACMLFFPDNWPEQYAAELLQTGINDYCEANAFVAYNFLMEYVLDNLTNGDFPKEDTPIEFELENEPEDGNYQ